MKEINSNKETLKRNLLDLIELQHILKKTQVFFQEVSHFPYRAFCPCNLPSLPVAGGGSEHASGTRPQAEGQRCRT